MSSFFMKVFIMAQLHRLQVSNAQTAVQVTSSNRAQFITNGHLTLPSSGCSGIDQNTFLNYQAVTSAFINCTGSIGPTTGNG
eukprot:COSAG01_NODE_27353_length_688_cov_0.478778_1_plen_81_part_10